jgi:Ca2+-binding RTX toxin-like protein
MGLNIRGSSGNDSLVGRDGNDLLNGLGGNDYLYGDSGNDTLLGGGGNDSLYGSFDNDFLNGGTDDDSLNGSQGNDFLSGREGNDYLYGNDGNDTLLGWTGDDALYGSFGNDIINGWTGNNTLNGGGGNDILNSYEGNDSLDGGDENDIIYGRGGNDYLLGDDGNDTLLSGTGDDSIYGSFGNDIINSDEGDDSVNGGDENDIIYGRGGNDYLLGDDGNDTLLGGTGFDSIYGSFDNDVLIGTNGDSGIGTVDTLRGGNDTDFFILTNGRVVFYNNNRVPGPGLGDFALIEDFDPTEDFLVLKGQVNDYFLSVSPFTDSNVPGTAIYYDSNRNGSYNTANDELIAIVQSNVEDFDLRANYFRYISNVRISDAYAVEGFNRFANFTVRLSEPISDAISFRYTTVNGTAKAGLDYVARTGFVTFAPGQTQQTINIPILNNNFNEPNETFRVVLSYPQNPTVAQEVGIGVISDTLRSSASIILPRLVENLTLIGNKNINGTGNANSNIITGNQGNNRLSGLAGNDLLTGGIGNDFLNGGVGADRMFGGTGNDLINGGAGNDTLIGSTGNDILVGSFGNDIISGGAGRDRIVFNSRNQRIDTIADFAPVADTIIVSARGFGGGLRRGILPVSQFRLGSGAAERSDRFIYNRNNGVLSFDADGTGGLLRIPIAILDPGLPVTHSDIVVV